MRKVSRKASQKAKGKSQKSKVSVAAASQQPFFTRLRIAATFFHRVAPPQVCPGSHPRLWLLPDNLFSTGLAEALPRRSPRRKVLPFTFAFCLLPFDLVFEGPSL